MTGKVGNSQNRLAKESMFSALMMLMEKEKFKDIAVTELTKKAGVSRMAFYRNYKTLEDIIVDYLDENFVGYADRLLPDKGENCRLSVKLFFTFFKSQAQLTRNLINAGLTHLLLESCSNFLRSLSRNIVCDRRLSPEIERYNIEFVAGGIYKVLIEWVKNDMKESEESMAGIVQKLLAV